MQVKCINDSECELGFTDREIEGLAKTSVYIGEIKEKIEAGELRKDQALFESLVDFLLDIRDGFLQVSN